MSPRVLAPTARLRLSHRMVIIRFPDLETKRRALGFLARRFSGKSWATGEVMVPDAALAPLAAEGIRFTVEGPDTYDHAHY